MYDLKDCMVGIEWIGGKQDGCRMHMYHGARIDSAILGDQVRPHVACWHGIWAGFPSDGIDSVLLGARGQTSHGVRIWHSIR